MIFKKLLTIAGVLLTSIAPLGAADISSVIPIRVGTYVPDGMGCDAAAAGLFYVTSDGFGRNKVTGKVLSSSGKNNHYSVKLLWIEVDAQDTDGVADAAVIEVKSDTSFFISNLDYNHELLSWCG